MINIFYSWQSDLMSINNRNFIEDSIKKAVKSINGENLNVDICIDRDTKNVPGTPEIVSTIFEKILKSQIFICDVTIINSHSGFKKIIASFIDKSKRLTPNPNVLTELGFAASCIGWENIICVLNTAYCRIEDLPFDIRGRRICVYRWPNELNDKAQERKDLANKLAIYIRKILENKRNHQDSDFFDFMIYRQVDNTINIIGKFITYFLNRKLGNKKASEILQTSFYSNIDYSKVDFKERQDYRNCTLIDDIMILLQSHDFNSSANVVTNTGKSLSWTEFWISSLEEVYYECENLLFKYGSSGQPKLIVQVEAIKSYTITLIGISKDHFNDSFLENYNPLQPHQAYINSLVKPYILEMIKLRSLITILGKK